MKTDDRNLIRILNHYLLKLPGMCVLMAFGVIFETLLSLPFIIACWLDGWVRSKK